MRAPLIVALLSALAAGGCAIEAVGVAGDLASPRVGVARIAIGEPAPAGEPVAGIDGRCQAEAGTDPARLRARSGRVEIGMSECQLIDLNGPADAVEVTRGPSGERVARLDYDDAAARNGLASYVFVGNRLTRVER